MVVGHERSAFNTVNRLGDRPTWSQQREFGILAILALFFTVYKMATKNLELQDRLKPRIRAECGSEIEGSRTELTQRPFANPHGQILWEIVRFYRIRVNAISLEPIVGCRGQLVRIEKDGLMRWGNDEAILT